MAILKGKTTTQKVRSEKPKQAPSLRLREDLMKRLRIYSEKSGRSQNFITNKIFEEALPDLEAELNKD